ncbi:Hypothetical protein, putative [Bodo saltans]|uniref:Uncharacterized protein n=1 Tax=Bodo saltans TaxID=75058 RepID=A0A0S4JN00_BODSA|nr:Hypothetical protein, putative [Bodo saltans]|eukprot:CUG91533.1 Hypothetical protein, putative [Bodo saltans]
MGQPYIRYPRMVLSLLDAPFLVDHPNVESLYPADVVARARKYLCAMGGPTKTGAYTPPHGFAFVRKIVADYITKRDREIVQRCGWGSTTNGEGAEQAVAPLLAEHVLDDVLMTDGASVGVRQIMQLVCGRFGYKPPARSPADFDVPDFAKVAAGSVAQVEDGILVPVPAYPLYTALLTLLGVQGMLYYLEESTPPTRECGPS